MSPKKDEYMRGYADGWTEAAPEMLAALLHVRSIIAEGAATGFQPLEGTWAERLYASQQMAHAAVTKAVKP